MKKFKSKKRNRYFHLIVGFIITFFVFCLTINFLSKIKLTSSNEEFINAMLNDSNHHVLYDQQKNNYFGKFLKYLLNLDLKNPQTILNSVFQYKSKEESNDADEEKDEHLTDYISDPDSISVSDPVVYIYNTHQLESYNLENYAEYNITPNVQMAAYLLKGLLNKASIPTIVETGNINDFLSLNGWNYASSYKASRYYLEEAVKQNPNLKLIIDLHRDSIPKDKSTITIGDKNYAKILFVIGTDYDKYEENLSLATTLNNIIQEKYPNLSRGIITKGGAGVNGVYNQDINNKIVLIECGGNENTIDEVMNTMVALKETIQTYLEELNG